MAREEICPWNVPWQKLPLDHLFGSTCFSRTNQIFGPNLDIPKYDPNMIDLDLPSSTYFFGPIVIDLYLYMIHRSAAAGAEKLTWNRTTHRMYHEWSQGYWFSTELWHKAKIFELP